MFRSYTEKVYRPDLKSQSSRSPKEQWFSCDLCNVDEIDLESHWRNETDVEIHRKEAHLSLITQQKRNNGDRFCTVCMTLQESKAALISHVKHRHLFSSPHARRVEREIYACGHCNRIFFNKAVLEVHIQYMHLWSAAQRRKKTFDCPKCKKTCLLRLVWFHMQRHEIPSLSICDICLNLSPNVKDLMVHVKDHPMYYKCEICNYQTNKEYIFETHLDRHKVTPYKKDKSVLKKFVRGMFLATSSQGNPTNYNIHHVIKGLTLPESIRVCILCREICTDKNAMFEHVCDHVMSFPEPQKKPLLRCHCGEQFLSRVLLRHHVFKLKGSHRDATDDERAIEQKPEERNETGERDVTIEQTAIEWLDDIDTEEIHQGEPSPDDETVVLTDPGTPMDTETPETIGNEKGEEEIVYIYAAVSDEELPDY